MSNLDEEWTCKQSEDYSIIYVPAVAVKLGEAARMQ